MLRLFLIIFFITLSQQVLPSDSQNIINHLQKTNNLTFNFIQSVDEKKEQGKCVIKYPKKILCKYDNFNKKTIVSNGKSLVIKNNNYYIYPLEKTALSLLLDKEYLISKLSNSKPRKLDKKYLNYQILENNNEINIFFDKKSFNLVGWQIEDIFQNLSITFISSVRINQNINDKIFELPKKDD
jgi:outer membrane lipoprotein-sorting protein